LPSRETHSLSGDNRLGKGKSECGLAVGKYAGCGGTPDKGCLVRGGTRVTEEQPHIKKEHSENSGKTKEGLE